MNNLKILIIVFSIGLFGLWTYPSWKSVKALKIEQKGLEAELGKQQENIQKIKPYANPKISGDKAVYKRIPQQKQQDILIRDLTQMAQKTGFVFEGINFSQGVDSVIQANNIGMTLSVSGRKSQLYTFLKSLEVNERFLLLDDVNVSFEDKNGISVARLTLNLHAFSQN